MNYRSRRDPQHALRVRMRELAASRVRFGYRRLTVMLRREGWAAERKVVDGFCCCPAARWTLVPGADGGGSVYARMPVAPGRQLAHRPEGGIGTVAGDRRARNAGVDHSR
jgi:hypothetical protein